jgi:nitrite reductase (NADH) large subunit
MALICHCYGVSDRQVRALAEEGATSLDRVQDCTSAGTGCGGCLAAVEAALERACANLTASAAA